MTSRSAGNQAADSYEEAVRFVVPVAAQALHAHSHGIQVDYSLHLVNLDNLLPGFRIETAWTVLTTDCTDGLELYSICFRARDWRQRCFQ